MNKSTSNKPNVSLEALPDEFFRYYLNKQKGMPKIGKQTKVKRVPNVFDEQNDHKGNTLEIDLEKRICHDITQNNTYDFEEYLAELSSFSPLNDSNYAKLEEHLQTEYWYYEEYLRKLYKDALFQFDEKKLQWYKKANESGVSGHRVTDFNLVIYREIYTYKEDADNEGRWNRHFEVSLEYRKDDGRVEDTGMFKLNPDQTVKAIDLQKAVWNVTSRQIYMKDTEVREFIKHLENYYQPPKVYQYDYFGFITYRYRKYFLARNVLISIPENDTECLLLIAPDEHESFPVEDDEYIQLAGFIETAPKFELGEPDSNTGMYEEAMKSLYHRHNASLFLDHLEEVRSWLCDMIAGKLPENQQHEGSLLLSYVFSFLFFDEIHKTFGHVIFIYLFGKANTGKGKMAEILLSFFGISSIDKIASPTTTALENSLYMHAKIPAWMDEFVPDNGTGKGKISDQLFNTWFELNTRNVGSGSNWKRNAYKVTRGMLLFTSNYQPQSDHLNSRMIKMLTARDKRGAESSYYRLAENSRRLQNLFISSLQWYHTFDRSLFRKELRRYKQELKKAVKTKLGNEQDKNGIEYNIEDRQLQQVAALLTTNLFLTLHKHYRDLFIKYNELENEDQASEINSILTGYRKQNGFFDFCVSFIAETAKQVSSNDPLTDFLDTVGFLVEEGRIGKKEFAWLDDDLKMQWARVWERYESHKMGNAVPKKVIEDALASKAEGNGKKTMSWMINDQGSKRKYTAHGYYLKQIAQDQRFKYAFDHPGLKYDSESPESTSN